MTSETKTAEFRDGRREGIAAAAAWLSKITLSFYNPRTGGTIESNLADVAERMKTALSPEGVPGDE